MKRHSTSAIAAAVRYRNTVSAVLQEGWKRASSLKSRLQAASAEPVNSSAANDNSRVENRNTRYVPSHRQSFVSVVQEGKGAPRTVVAISPEDARDLKIKVGDCVTVQARYVTDPFYATAVWAFSVSHALPNSPSAVKVEPNGGGVRVRPRGVCAILMERYPVYLSPTRYAPAKGVKGCHLFLPWKDAEIAFLELKTLALTRAGLARRLLLAGWRPSKDAGAGNECFTPSFVFRWGLTAANRSEYDVDICTMNGVGDYRVMLEGLSHLKASWGAVPEKYRDLGTALTPVPARKRYTADGPFGSLTQPWDGDLLWINPPYEQRTWACFMERAHREVERDGRKLFLTLGPDDNVGPHSEVLYGRLACKITLERQLPFFKARSRSIEPIKGNQLVVFGSGLRMRRFLWRLTAVLYEDGFISAEQKRNINRKYALGMP